MGVPVERTNRVGSSLDIGGTDLGSSQPYMSPTDKHFAAGGSIFTAPGVSKSASSEPSQSDSGGGSISSTNAAAGAADGSATDADASSNASAKSTEQIKPVPAQVAGQVKAGEAKITKNTEDAVKFGEASQEQGDEITALAAERDAALSEAEDQEPDTDSAGTPATPPAAPTVAPVAAAPTTAPSANNPFAPTSDGTGAGKDSAFSLSVGGATADAPTLEAGDKSSLLVGPKNFSHARPQPEGGLDEGASDQPPVVETEPTTAPTAATPTATPTTAPTQPTATPTAGTTTAPTTTTASDSGNTGNTEAQDKVDDLDGQIEDKTAAKAQTDQQAGSAVNGVKAEYKARAAGVKREMAAMDGKINDAAKYEKAAQVTTLSGQASTTAGGIATATGAVYTAKGTAALTAPGGGAAVAAPLFATGTAFSIAGVSATGAGGIATVAGAGLKMHADNQKASATAAKADIAAEGKQLNTFYAKQLGKAMAADRAAGKSA